MLINKIAKSGKEFLLCGRDEDSTGLLSLHIRKKKLSGMKSLCRGGCYENKHIAIKLHKHKLETLEITVAFRRNVCVFFGQSCEINQGFLGHNLLFVFF